MKSTKIIGILLIVGSLFLGYSGFNKIKNSSSSVKIIDLELGVSNKTEKELGYIYIGLAVVIFGGGVYTLKKKH
jgi:hypothetical protein